MDLSPALRFSYEFGIFELGAKKSGCESEFYRV